jgi:small subunit ribosomal protein S1
MKQLLPHPWDAVPEKYKVGDRVRGAVTRIADFGAFVELEPGVEGLVHVSEMSWAKKVRTPGDLVKSGDIVEVVILGIKPEERRMSLGLKQALGDPWADAAQRFAVGSVIEGTVIGLPKFGAFVQLSEGVEGLIHVSEISADKRINHPQEVLKVGQVVKAQVMALDTEKRLIRLSIKQLVPTGLDEYLSEHKTGDRVTGRLAEIVGSTAKVELGEGVFAACDIVSEDAPNSEAANSSSGNVSALGSMLMARWKGGGSGGSPKPEPVREGQIRTFRIAKLDPETKKIKLALA